MLPVILFCVRFGCRLLALELCQGRIGDARQRLQKALVMGMVPVTLPMNHRTAFWIQYEALGNAYGDLMRASPPANLPNGIKLPL